MDSGASDNLASEKVVSSRSGKDTFCDSKWQTQVGAFVTNKKVNVPGVKLSQFTLSRSFCADFHLFKPSANERYDF